MSHSFLPLETSYAVPDIERPTVRVSPVMDSSTESALSNRPPSATFPLQPLAPVFRSICWSWLHLALLVEPLMYAMTTLSSDVFCGVAAQIFCGNVSASQAGLPLPTSNAKTCLYAALTAALPVIHRPGASAPEPGASGADLYQSTFASPGLRPAFRFSSSVPPLPLPSPGLTGSSDADAFGLPLGLSLATGFFPSSPPLVTAHTVPPTTSSPATAAAMTSPGLPLNGFFEPPGGGVPGPPGYVGCCG